MNLNAVGVTSSNIKKTVQFYTLLGLQFPAFADDEGHAETTVSDTSAKLMIDTKEIVKQIIGEDPVPGNHSSFAIEYDTPAEVDAVAEKVRAADFTVVKEPWDALWGQRYCLVRDPDGYMVDLYAALKKA
ncbi:VOC family protein [Candidatus Woesebacteria bacterium]|nr:VOC family protein [Candidatus Woesebacteria bacterium]